MRRDAEIGSVSVYSRKPFTPWRWALVAAGLTCFAMGIVGTLVPGMPTTVFLLIGSFALTRSCPWLEEKMLGVPVLRPYAAFVRSTEPMSPRLRRSALVLMSASVAASLIALALAERLTPVIGAVIGSLWVAGFISIMMFRRPPAASR